MKRFDFCEHCGRLVEYPCELLIVWVSDEYGTWQEALCMACLRELSKSSWDPQVMQAA